jgi:hypothetical protein
MVYHSFLSYSEIVEWLFQFAEQNKAIVKLEVIGLSDEGREIHAVHVTNKANSIENKEVVLIILGRHGDEIGTRVVSKALLAWLASPEATRYVDNQHIIVVPVANPDACVKEIFGLPAFHLSTLEKNSILKFGLKYIPDVVFDIHSVGKEKYGFNWGGLEAIVIDEQATAGEDQYIIRAMAEEMIRGASRAGFPFLLHNLEFYKNLRIWADALSESAFNNYVNRVFYDAFHSLTFGAEVNHFVLSPDEAAKSGVAVIQSLLEMGLRTYPWEYYPGYPNRILCGDFLASIKPFGENAHQRRISRRELWLQRHCFDVPLNPHRKMLNDHSVNVLFKYSGEQKIQNGLTVNIRIRGQPNIKQVDINGTGTDYYTKADECSTYVGVEFTNLKPNDLKEIHIEF